MKFELDEILLNDILFSMENQDGDFVLDTHERMVVDIYVNDSNEEIDLDNDERYIALPQWDSNDGYQLMEKFASSLKNPLIREGLAAALNRNKGVFRAFRDVLAQYPETEKQWYNFKDQEMKNIVIEWYNGLREEWGLEPIGSEPEDNFSLVLEDFVIREQGTDNKEQILKKAFYYSAEAANGDLAGSIRAVVRDSVLHIDLLEVNEEFRGMGIGKLLLSKVLEKADHLKLEATIDLPSESDFFSRTLYLESFEPCMQRFIRKREKKEE
ncbi:MAG: GNAT family N-acetyltransferase [Treponema sp.]|jgi:GNAT superfamily N-acetyltransferase|nr:GNAT family N-acetyltransferase [Treponema sp.]